MTVNPSIDPARLLEEQLAQASRICCASCSARSSTRCCPRRPTRCAARSTARSSPERVNRRNGYRHRDFDTRAGTLDVAIPKLRSGLLLPRLAAGAPHRAEPALTTVVATCYLLGVSTRRMDKLVQSLGITGAVEVAGLGDGRRSSTTTSRSSAPGPLAEAGPFTFVAADALVMKVREGGRVVPVHALVATGINADGHREILGIQVTTSEDGAGWLGFFRDLVARGLTGVRLVTSDAHAGLVAAIAATLPGAAWQRCRTHYAANLMAITPKPAGAGSRRCCTRSMTNPTPKPCTPSSTGSSTPSTEAARRRRPPRRRPRRHPRLHRLPQGGLAADLVQQPQRAAQPRDPPPHRRRRDLPRPGARSSAWSAPSSPSNTTNGPKAAATSASTSSPAAAQPSTPPHNRGGDPPALQALTA